MNFEFMDVSLRTSSKQDTAFICRLEQDSENSQFITPWRLEKHESAFDDEDIFHSIIFQNQVAVGFLILAGIKNPNQSIEFMRIVIGEKNKGLGRKALQAVKRLCFEKLNVHRLWLDVKTFNERAKHLYQSEGFIVEGTLRECLKSGDQFESLTILSILESEFRRQ
jgi:RimJ/RimL family protein N-acetyltransferase